MTTIDSCFSFNELGITQKDLLDLAPEQSRGLEEFPDALQEVLNVAGNRLIARGGYRILPLEACNATALTLGGKVFETGRIIAKPFKKANSVAVFACTAGHEVHTSYTGFIAKGDPLNAYIMDTIGTVVVEKAMNRIAAELDEKAAQSGLQCSNRYSPGYCGWHVGEQQKLWSLLPRGYCGITLTSASLMTPVKSISGMIGLGKDVKKLPYACSGCHMEHCMYRQRPTHI